MFESVIFARRQRLRHMRVFALLSALPTFEMIPELYIKLLTLVNLGIRYRTRRNPALKCIKRRKAEFYADSWRGAAMQTGANCEDLGSGFFRISRGGASIKVFEQYNQLIDRVTEKFLANKSTSNRILTELGMPVPRSLCLEKLNLAAAKSFLSEVDGPVVVKPASGTAGGDGISTNVRSFPALLKAIAWARTFSQSVILEEQIEGENCRLLLLDGEIIDVIVRRAPCVTGDGKSSIRKLINQENHDRLYGDQLIAQNLIPIDLDTRNTLAAGGLGLHSVPNDGQQVAVRQVINCNRAEENETPKESLASSTVEMAREISGKLGVPLLGIDLITTDITRDLAAVGGVVIEVNTPPGHFYHHLKKGEAFPVATRLLEHAFDAPKSQTEPAARVDYQSIQVAGPT